MQCMEASPSGNKLVISQAACAVCYLCRMTELGAELESSAGVGQKKQKRSKFKPTSLPYVYDRRDSLSAPRPDPRLFALSRPGGPLASRGQSLCPNLKIIRIPHISKGPADVSSVTTVLPASEVKQRQLRPTLPLTHHPHYPQQQTRRTSTASGAVAIGHSADLRIQPLRFNNRCSQGVLGNQHEVCILVRISLAAILTSRNPAYRNLKTLPSNVHRAHRVPELAVLRPHVNQDTAEDTQTDRTRHWFDRLATEEYGMRPTGPARPTPEGVQETDHAPQGIEVSPSIVPFM